MKNTPILISSKPADDATAFAVDRNIKLKFSEKIMAGTGDIVISSDTDTRTIDITDSSQVSIRGRIIFINPAQDLNAGAVYNVQMAGGVILDNKGSPFAGISDPTTLNFTTLDPEPPRLISSDPADDVTGVALGSNILLTFNENVTAGIGDIVISSGTDTRTIAVTDASQISFSGNNVTINPVFDLNPDTIYHIQLANDVIKDIAGNAYAGISDAITLNFTTHPNIIAAVELSALEQNDNNGGFVIYGVSADDRSGFSVSSAGDVNGDGFADLIVGAWGDDPNGQRSGASFVVFGKPDSLAVELSAVEGGYGGFVINGVSADDRSGFSISNAGDVNGDGLADLIVGASFDDPNGNYSGASFVVFGKSDGTAVELSNVENGDGGFVINGASADDRNGFSVSSAGDVNGDGLDDVIVGALRDDPNGYNSGASLVVFGKPDGLAVELSAVENGYGGFVINGASAFDYSGRSVSSAGDVNGDGFADLIVGAYRDDPNGISSGASFVIFGGQGTSATIGTDGDDTLTGDSSANQLVAGAGNDLLLGNGGADVLRGGAGNDILAISDLTFASIDGGTGTDTLRFDAPLNADLGTIPNNRLSNLEIIDLNGTGTSGSSLTLTTDDILSLVGDEATNVLRINGDTTDTLDLSHTDFQDSGATTSIDGITYAIYQSSGAHLDTTVRVLVEHRVEVINRLNVISAVELSAIEQNDNNGGFVINGANFYDYSGESVSNAGDVNGDGFADLIVGAPRDDPNGVFSGASFVVFGKPDGLAVELSSVENGDGGFVINGVSAGDESGRSVSNAGDVNGDGFADLIVGAPRDDPNGVFSGASFVVFGKPDGLAVELSSVENGDGGFVINGVSAGDESGRSVSNAGDVNGDGLDDLIVGTDSDDPNGRDSGASFVVFGKPDGLAVELSSVENGDGGFVINGVSAGDESGRSVSNAGDVNGDGLDDLIVGAPRDNPNGIYSGASFVIFSKPDGLAVELSSVENGYGGFVINGVSARDFSGNSVSNAGDVNGDGLDDLIVGALQDDPNGTVSGASFVVFGKRDGAAVELSTVENGYGGFVINGTSEGDFSGRSVSNAGDVNGDGLADVLVGASGDAYRGASFVVFGKQDGTAVELSAVDRGYGSFVINGASEGDFSGLVSSAGDVNGDGFTDLIVGAPGDDPNGAYSGASFVVFGGQGTSATVGSAGNDTLTGDSSANQLVAGDGDDLLLGNGGADVLRGGAGNDMLAISDLTFASIDGGTGTDTLRFDVPLNLDLRVLADNKLNSIEIIDLTDDGGNSTLSLNLTDLIHLNEAQTATDTLVIHGSSGDSVNLDNNSNGQTGSWINAGGGVYEFNAGGSIGIIGTVAIDTDVSVTVVA